VICLDIEIRQAFTGGQVVLDRFDVLVLGGSLQRGVVLNGLDHKFSQIKVLEARYCGERTGVGFAHIWILKCFLFALSNTCVNYRLRKY